MAKLVAHAYRSALLEPLPRELRLRTGLSIGGAGQTRSHPRGVRREIILRRVLHVAQCHHGRRVPKQPLDADDGNACLCAMHAECMPEVVDPDVVQASFAAGALRVLVTARGVS